MKQSYLYDWMQLLSLECLIAIYCEGQPSLGGIASRGLGFVHNVMGINLCTTQWPWVEAKLSHGRPDRY